MVCCSTLHLRTAVSPPTSISQSLLVSVSPPDSHGNFLSTLLARAVWRIIENTDGRNLEISLKTTKRIYSFIKKTNMNMNYYCDYYIDSDPLYYCTAFSSDHIPTLFLVNAEIFFSFDFHHNFSSVFPPLNFFLFLPLLKPITHLLHLPHLKYYWVTYSIILFFTFSCCCWCLKIWEAKFCSHFLWIWM